ncbi:phage major capsid protein [Mycobacterium kyogaense]|uniref:phage major capsid protein n=1 Tax=Mycobacterium kyogaense TaxID=2212479 RepID=UPI000DAD02AD|nr:phage major capsid protein [Mycobacterium kyogaense]
MAYAIDKRDNHDDSLLAPEIGNLVDQVVKAKAVAAQISTPVSTNRPKYEFPLLTAPVTTALIDELDDLPLSNLGTGSVTAIPRKFAGATQISTEMADDLADGSNALVADQIGASLSDQIVASLDAAVMGNLTAIGTNPTEKFAGLLSYASTAITVGASSAAIANLDNFVKAIYAAQNATVPGDNGVFVVSPATAEKLSLLKTGTSQNGYLLDFQEDGSIVVAGKKLLITPLTDAGTQFWYVVPGQHRLVTRQGTEVRKTYVPQNDSWFISATYRADFVSLAPETVVRGKFS